MLFMKLQLLQFYNFFKENPICNKFNILVVNKTLTYTFILSFL